MNKWLFFILYLILTILTYVWRLVGFGLVANSATTPEATGSGAIWVTGSLAVVYIIMAVLAYKRGKTNKRSFLISFPIIGGVFDVVLVFIPFVPTIMNILALVFGLMSEKKEA